MENNLIKGIQDALKRLGVRKKDRLLLAVSGGVDSVVLTYCCAKIGLDFAIAHANFQLRGPESDRDEDFVRLLAEKFKKPFLVRKFDTAVYAKNKKFSIQVAARELRYNWFNGFLGSEQGSYDFLLTAHHSDDNIETLLMHFFRGTGIAGLQGIPEKKERIIRPMLFTSKSDLKSFAIKNHLDWMEDSSNATVDYTRNYFRNQLIPSLEVVYPDLLQNLGNNISRFKEAGILYEQAILQHKKKLLHISGSEIHIPILKLKKTIPLKSVCFEMIKEYHFSASQTDEFIHLLDSTNGKYISSPSHRIIKNREWLIIAPLQGETSAHIIIEKGMSSVAFTEGNLQIKETAVTTGQHYKDDPLTAFLDAEKIQFPLMLRKWKSGDYFYPLGMQKKKKLARFFIDQKLSKTAKEKIWVLVMGSQIVWVVSRRIDDRFRIRPSTKQVLQIRNADVLIRS